MKKNLLIIIICFGVILILSLGLSIAAFIKSFDKKMLNLHDIGLHKILSDKIIEVKIITDFPQYVVFSDEDLISKTKNIFDGLVLTKISQKEYSGFLTLSIKTDVEEFGMVLYGYELEYNGIFYKTNKNLTSLLNRIFDTAVERHGTIPLI